MALQDILKKIRKETEDKLKKIEDEHRIKLKKLEEEFEKKKKNAAEEMRKKVESNVEKIHSKIQIMAKMEAKNMLLKEKRKVIEDVFHNAMNKLAESSEYENMLVQLLRHKALTYTDAEIISAKGKEDQTRSAIAKAGRPFKLSEKSANIIGGFILTSGKVEVDNSIESIMRKELRDELELEIAKVLF